MGLIETIKEVAELVQKSDNIELLRQMLTLEREAHDTDRKLRDRERRIDELEEQGRIAADRRGRRGCSFLDHGPAPRINRHLGAATSHLLKGRCRAMQRSATVPLVGLALGAVCALAQPAEATLVRLVTFVKVKAVDPEITSLMLRDTFLVFLDVDDSILDDDPSVDAGHFQDLAASLFMKASKSNTGSWPSGVFIPDASDGVTDPSANTFTVTLRGTSFPDGGNPSLPVFDIVTDWRLLFGDDIMDQGLGETFAEQFSAGFGADVSNMLIRFGADELNLVTATLKRAPEPSVTSLLLGVLLLLARRSARPRC